MKSDKLVPAIILIVIAIIIFVLGWMSIEAAPDVPYEPPRTEYVEIDGVCLKFTPNHRSAVIDCNSAEWQEHGS
jgi:hypothetical protein